MRDCSCCYEGVAKLHFAWVGKSRRDVTLATMFLDDPGAGAFVRPAFLSDDPIEWVEMYLDYEALAGRQPASVYRRSTMYTTLSPCDMCTGAILLYGIPRVVIGENRTFMGGEDYLRSRGVEVIVADDPECIRMMEEFIAEEPELWNEDIGE